MIIDEKGYRANVGIILCNSAKQVFWGHRVSQDALGWQFPQGGIHQNEQPLEAMYRELHEEVGLEPLDVKLLGQTQNWLTYEFEKEKVSEEGDRYIGQKQQWFLLQLQSSDENICLDSSEKPEFDTWHWVDYWYPMEQVVIFKRAVYQAALTALFPYLET